MALIDALILAQFSIDFATDTLVGESFGMDLASFTVVTASQNYTIDFDDDSQADDEQRQVLASATGATVTADGPLLVAANAGPPEGLDITSTGIVAGAFVAATSANTYRFTIIRQGVVS